MYSDDTGEALSRTLLLMRDDLLPAATDQDLLTALTSIRVLLVADRANSATRQGQDALVTAFLLAARAGAQLYIDVPESTLLGFQAPLRGNHLLRGLLEAGEDLVPGSHAVVGVPQAPTDLAIVIGDSPWHGKANLAVRLIGDAWTGAIVPASEAGTRWGEPTGSPFGALAAAGLAAGEAFKAAMRRVARLASMPDVFSEYFAPITRARVSLAPPGTPPPGCDLGAFDTVSGGAIIQAALYALGRIPGVRGTARVIEPDSNELSNVNRYAFLRMHRRGIPKADDLAHQFAGLGVQLTPLRTRFDRESLARLGDLAPSVLVGVDHIPTRWLVQEEAMRQGATWLGIGATSHYAAVASFHSDNTPCARCMHPVDDPDVSLIPTVAFVSHWAGTYLAALFSRHAAGEVLPLNAQSTYATLLRPHSPTATWVGPIARRQGCQCGGRVAA